jgi:hypothetical protein
MLIRDQLSHAYLLDLDGMVNAWSGLYWKLRSNSLVIKLKSPYEQWYYDALVPYKHFVPMNSLEEVHDVWTYLSNNDCSSIVEASTSFIQGINLPYALQTYVIH